MRSPQQFWEATCEDTRWLDAQAAVLEDAMREAFAAGHFMGAQAAAQGVVAHAVGLGSNLVLRLPESVSRGMCALASRLIDLGPDPAVVEAAWKRCVRAAGSSAADAAAKAAG
jgi:hypothetical protein